MGARRSGSGCHNGPQTGLRLRWSNTGWLVLLLIFLCLVVGGCGSVGTPGSGEEGSVDPSCAGATRTYTNRAFDFSFDYDPLVMEGPKNIASPSSNSPGMLSMRFTTSDDNGLFLMAEELDATVAESDADWVEKELASEMDALATYLDPNGTRTPLEAVDANGARGFVTTFSYSYEGVAYRARQYLLFRNNFQYKLSMSDTVDRWDAVRECFDLVIGTFRPAE